MYKQKCTYCILIGLVFIGLSFLGCGGGSSDDDGSNLSSSDRRADGAPVTIKGTISYEFVPFKSEANPVLDYGNIKMRKARGVVVVIVDEDGSSLGYTTTDENGQYAISVNAKRVKIQVYAQLFKKASNGQSSWNVKVKDNTNRDAMYVIEGSFASVGDNSTQTRNLAAPSGWGGNAYTSTRLAAPFSILDVVYDGIKKVESAQSNIVFPKLDIFWSKHNLSNWGKKELGQIGTSHFSEGSLYILGKENSDTDEYDVGIIAHEWGHYYEAMFSRSDSPGGNHSSGDMLDISLAFGEGFGNAISSIIRDNPIYFDSLGNRQQNGWSMNLESEVHNNPGWFSEASVQRILYDIYDSHDDNGDTLSLGFTPIHKAMVLYEKNTIAFTSLFSFITALKEVVPGNDTAIDAITTNENIAPINNIWAKGRTNRPQNASFLYSFLAVGSSVDFQTNYSAVSNRSNYVVSEKSQDNNKLGIYNYVAFEITTAGTYRIGISKVSGDYSSKLDPDFKLYKDTSKKALASADSFGFTEELEKYLEPGVYRLKVIVYSQTSGAVFRVTVN